MKYTILGFSQKRLLELGLGVDEALVLDWFVTFQGSGRMRSILVDGVSWFWVNYSGVLEDIPIAGGSEKTISRRFQALKNAGVLNHYTIREGGTFSCFRLNPAVYDSLVSDLHEAQESKKSVEIIEEKEEENTPSTPRTDLSNGRTELSNPRTDLGDPLGQNCPTPSDKSVRPKDSLTKETILLEELLIPPMSPQGDLTGESSKKFSKPTVAEIAEYCALRKNGINAQEFYDHYESNGWKVGRNPMKSWQAAVRTWEHSRTKNKTRYTSESTPASITGFAKIGGTR